MHDAFALLLFAFAPQPAGTAPTNTTIDPNGPAPAEPRAPMDPVQPATTGEAGEVGGESRPFSSEAPAADPQPAAPVNRTDDPFEIDNGRPAATTRDSPQPTARRERRIYPDRPIRWRIEAQLDGGTQTPTDGSYRAFDDGKNMAGLGIGLRGDARMASSRVFVGGGVFYRRYGTERQIFDGVLDNDLEIHEPLFFVRVSIVAIEGFDVYAEPGGGPTFIDLQTNSVRGANQRSVTGLFNGLAGFTAYLPKAWLPRRGAARMTAGIDLGVGYAYRGPIDIEPSPTLEPEPLDTTGANLGTLELGGFTWRAGLFVRFM